MQKNVTTVTGSGTLHAKKCIKCHLNISKNNRKNGGEKVTGNQSENRVENENENNKKFMKISKDWIWIKKEKRQTDVPLIEKYEREGIVMLFFIASRVDMHGESRFTLMELKHYFGYTRNETAKEKMNILTKMEEDKLLVKKEYLKDHYVVRDISPILFPKKNFIILTQGEIRKILTEPKKIASLILVLLVLKFFINDETKEGSVSQVAISDMTKLSRKTVVRSLKDLEELEIIIKKGGGFNKKTGRNNMNTYRLFSQEMVNNIKIKNKGEEKE